MNRLTARILIAVVTVAVLVGALSGSAFAKRGYSYKALYGTPVIDGEIDEIWNGAQDAYLKWNWRNSPNTSKPLSRCHAFVMHDGTYLYILAVVHDYSPSASDKLEIYLDEEYTLLSKEQTAEKYGSGKLPDYAYQLGVPVSGMSGYDPSYGAKGAKSLNEDQTYKSVVVDAKCKSIPANKDSQGVYTIYQLEIKMKPLTSIPQSGTWGLEFMYNDTNGETGAFQSAFRWNCDTVSNDDNSVYDDYPYESTQCYAPLTFAAQGEKVVEQTPLYPVERQTDKPLQPYTETEAQTEKTTESQTESQTEKQTERQTEIQTESQTEMQTEGQTESQTEKEAATTGSGDETEKGTNGPAPDQDGKQSEGQKENPGSSGGCGSVLGAGLPVLFLGAACGTLVCRRGKKEENK